MTIFVFLNEQYCKMHFMLHIHAVTAFMPLHCIYFMCAWEETLASQDPEVEIVIVCNMKWSLD